MGIAPVIEHEGRVLGESDAIVDDLLGRCGPCGFSNGPADADFADYLHWLHCANGTLQPTLGRNMILRRTGRPAEHPVVAAMRSRQELALALDHMEARCATAAYLAGDAFSAADIMSPQVRAAPSPPPAVGKETWGGPTFPGEQPPDLPLRVRPPAGDEKTWGDPAFFS